MSISPIARRYARALYEDVAQQAALERADADMELIRATLADSAELQRLFESPVVSRERKQGALRALFAEHVAPQTMQLVDLMVAKGREALFPEVVAAYREIRDAELGIVEARARIAQPMDEAEERKLREALEALTGKRVRLESELDPELLGGVVVRVGDTVYDGSVRHKLNTLREQLEEGAFAN